MHDGKQVAVLGTEGGMGDDVTEHVQRTIAANTAGVSDEARENAERDLEGLKEETAVAIKEYGRREGEETTRGRGEDQL
jgi:hypothetical protein